MPGTNDEQPISKTQLRIIEKHLDNLFNKLGLDIVFTNHFFDRLNDSRNKKQITTSELVMIYTSLYDKFGVDLSHLGTDDDIDRLIHSLSTDINIPIQISYDRKTKKINILAKTIMRVKKFYSSSKEVVVEKLTFKQFCNKL